MQIIYKKIPVIVDDQKKTEYDSVEAALGTEIYDILTNDLGLSSMDDMGDVSIALAAKKNRKFLSKIKELIQIAEQVEVELSNAKIEFV